MSEEVFVLPREDEEPLTVVYRDFPVPEHVVAWHKGKPIPEIAGGMDGAFYRDSKPPWVVVDQAAVTLLTTDLNLFPAALTLVAANYWWAGKTVKLTAWGKMTTAATPGNIVVGVGIGSANPPTAIKKSVAAALIASKTDLTWWYQAYATCRLTGTAGTVMFWGKFEPHVGLVASTASPILVPDSANTAVTVDTTLSSSLTLTANRSGSTAETMATQQLYIEALN